MNQSEEQIFLKELTSHLNSPGAFKTIASRVSSNSKNNSLIKIIQIYSKLYSLLSEKSSIKNSVKEALQEKLDLFPETSTAKEKLNSIVAEFITDNYSATHNLNEMAHHIQPLLMPVYGENMAYSIIPIYLQTLECKPEERTKLLSEWIKEFSSLENTFRQSFSQAVQSFYGFNATNQKNYESTLQNLQQLMLRDENDNSTSQSQPLIDAYIHTYAAECYAILSDIEAFSNEAEKTLQIYTNTNDTNTKTSILHFLQNILLNQALNLTNNQENPLRAKVHFILGCIFEAISNNKAKAIEQFKSAIQFNHPMASIKLAQYNRKQENYTDTVELLVQAIEKKDRNSTLAALTQFNEDQSLKQCLLPEQKQRIQKHAQTLAVTNTKLFFALDQFYKENNLDNRQSLHTAFLFEMGDQITQQQLMQLLVEYSSQQNDWDAPIEEALKLHAQQLDHVIEQKEIFTIYQWICKTSINADSNLGQVISTWLNAFSSTFKKEILDYFDTLPYEKYLVNTTKKKLQAFHKKILSLERFITKATEHNNNQALKQIQPTLTQCKEWLDIIWCRYYYRHITTRELLLSQREQLLSQLSKNTKNPIFDLYYSLYQAHDQKQKKIIPILTESEKRKFLQKARKLYEKNSCGEILYCIYEYAIEIKIPITQYEGFDLKELLSAALQDPSVTQKQKVQRILKTIKEKKIKEKKTSNVSDSILELYDLLLILELNTDTPIFEILNKHGALLTKYDNALTQCLDFIEMENRSPLSEPVRVGLIAYLKGKTTLCENNEAKERIEKLETLPPSDTNTQDPVNPKQNGVLQDNASSLLYPDISQLYPSAPPEESPEFDNPSAPPEELPQYKTGKNQTNSSNTANTEAVSYETDYENFISLKGSQIPQGNLEMPSKIESSEENEKQKLCEELEKERTEKNKLLEELKKTRAEKKVLIDDYGMLSEENQVLNDKINELQNQLLEDTKPETIPDPSFVDTDSNKQLILFFMKLHEKQQKQIDAQQEQINAQQKQSKKMKKELKELKDKKQSQSPTRPRFFRPSNSDGRPVRRAQTQEYNIPTT